MPVWLITIAAKAWSALGKIWSAVASFAVKYPWQAALIALACFTGWVWFSRYNAGFDASEASHRAAQAAFQSKFETVVTYTMENSDIRSDAAEKRHQSNKEIVRHVVQQSEETATGSELCVEPYLADWLRRISRETGPSALATETSEVR